ncbi:ElaB/YgaM/YqjD family protein [Phytopseudomonas dryadis]|uniref:DUF883 domain-containing protein n=1 Tax=Phytopseudomonas dryadis TaxID=2487520 RepID=A0A4Q9RC04_9GAMM|nr:MULTISPECIES: DUF883 family protein [Pseudomonas]TBU97559.1 DUF883 domain-containing protein [Pseudomonas dryadis]TBV10014.1 DUF883 domain-containing protein [Pseudomonas dryadis]TBV19157.1 DUF883 domain-containing protein [Pseudomonas sp. FRB 230]
MEVNHFLWSITMARKTSLEAGLEQFQNESTKELKKLLDQASKALGDAESFSGDKANEAREKVIALLNEAKGSISEKGKEAVELGRETLENAQDRIESNPWTSVAVASGFGLLIGLLLGRSSK